jgi:outer membrane receptor for ferrienterochelin and colicins
LSKNIDQILIMKQIVFFSLMLMVAITANAQRNIHGEVLNGLSGEPVGGVTVRLADSSRSVVADARGKFAIQLATDNVLFVSAAGFESKSFVAGNKDHVVILLTPFQKELDDVVVTGTMRVVRKLESPVAVEIYTPQFFKKNPAPSIFESLQNVNGVRPQLNCSVCNTGDIHINGLEGPYTMYD